MVTLDEGLKISQISFYLVAACVAIATYLTVLQRGQP
jgi:hypothetical protein